MPSVHGILATLLCLTTAMSLDAQAGAHRPRVLGVFSAQTGDPIEGAEVIDLFSKVRASTTATGTVSLSFLLDSGSVVRVQKIGYVPTTMVVRVSTADTLPVTVLLETAPPTLPTVVTKETAVDYISPRLREFETRRRSNGLGQFLAEAELRKNDNRRMADVMRSAGLNVRCSATGKSCHAVSTRQNAKRAFSSSSASCLFDVYVDGTRQRAEEADLALIPVNEMGGVEIYKGAAAVPSEYNMTGSACGVILFWTRER